MFRWTPIFSGNWFENNVTYNINFACILVACNKQCQALWAIILTSLSYLLNITFTFKPLVAGFVHKNVVNGLSSKVVVEACVTF